MLHERRPITTHATWIQSLIDLHALTKVLIATWGQIIQSGPASNRILWNNYKHNYKQFFFLEKGPTMHTCPPLNDPYA